MAPASARPQTLRLIAKIPPTIAIRPSIIPTGLLPMRISSLRRYHTMNVPLMMLNIPAAVGFHVFTVFQPPRSARPDACQALHAPPKTTLRITGTTAHAHRAVSPRDTSTTPHSNDGMVANASARRLILPRAPTTPVAQRPLRRPASHTGGTSITRIRPSAAHDTRTLGGNMASVTPERRKVGGLIPPLTTRFTVTSGRCATIRGWA